MTAPGLIADALTAPAGIGVGAFLLVTFAVAVALARRAVEEAAGLRRDLGRFSDLRPALAELRTLMASPPDPPRAPPGRSRSHRHRAYR